MSFANRTTRLDVESMEARTLLSAGVVAKSLDSAYVSDLYRDALGRKPTEGELLGASRPGTSASAFSRSIFESSTYQSLLVRRFYQRYLGVDPDSAGQRYWQKQLRRGASEQDVIAGFLSSSAYVAKAGGTSDRFVGALYRDVLARRADTSGLAYWSSRLNHGAAYAKVARGILDSNEALSREVSLTFKGLLGRAPTTTELASGVRALDRSDQPSAYRAAIASTAEYQGQTSSVPLASPIVGQTNVPNLSRLGYFNGTTFVPVSAGSIGSSITGQGGTNLYVIVHGWAPGYQSIVDANSKLGDPIEWWQLQGAVVGSTGAYSPWLYQGTQGGEPYVTPLGLSQSILAYDPKAVVLAFSWVDDSATGGSVTGLTEAYESEARTQVNGLRLASAIQDAESSTFLADGGQVHVLGHSHGTKVATVAAAELTRLGQAPTQLTLFDSPDDVATDIIDASNLLWYYLPNVNPTRTPKSSNGTFVDAYISEFSNPYASFPGLSSVVDTTLKSSVIYDLDEPGVKHDYGQNWYAGAIQVGPLAPPPPRVALGWSPLINPNAAAALPAEMSQTWTDVGQPQFALTTTQQTVINTMIPTYTALDYERDSTQGNVVVTSAGVTLSETGSSAVYSGTMYPEDDIDGITFDVTFTSPGDGDQLIVSVAGDDVFVMDGLSAGTTTRSVAVSLGSLIYDGFFGHSLLVTLASNGSATGSTVSVTNFREVKVEAS